MLNEAPLCLFMDLPSGGEMNDQTRRRPKKEREKDNPGKRETRAVRC